VKTIKKTARKTSTRKSARTAATRKSPHSTARKSPRGGTAAQKAAREKAALLESLTGLGLLDSDETARLEKKADSLAETAKDAPTRAMGWDRALRAALEGFRAAGGDGSTAHSLQGLMVWQGHLTEAPPSPEGIREALVALKKVVPYDGATLFLRNPDRKTVDPLLTVGLTVDLISRIRFTEGMGFSSWVAGRRKPVLYGSLHRNEAPGSERIRSFMAIPLVVGKQCVGVLNLGHAADGTYGPANLRVAVLAGGMLAGLVQRFVALGQIAAREITDPATGLATPSYVRSRLEEEVVRCRELGHSMSLLVLHLNELDEHAERFGGDYRERVRAELAAILREWKEPAELVGHDRGDGVLVLLPATRSEKARERAEAIKTRLEKHNFPRRKRMTVGLGLATYPSDAEGAQELYDSADKRLHEAAQSGPAGDGVYQPMAIS
jgi:diguanylate cyclase (GGDEF)-like protein